MSEILVHNTGGDALVYTTDGRLIGAHRTAPGDQDDPVTARLIDRGRLVITGDTDQTQASGLNYTAGETSHIHQTDADGEEVLEEPAGNASRTDWVAYAISQGLAAEDVAELKRDEIRDLLTTPADGDKSAHDEAAAATGGADTDSEEENYS